MNYSVVVQIQTILSAKREWNKEKEVSPQNSAVITIYIS